MISNRWQLRWFGICLFLLVVSPQVHAQVSASPASLSFGNGAVNNTSAAKNATLTNKTTAAISITSIAVGTGSPFAVKSTTCGSSLSAGKSCTIPVTFTPSALGAASGTLTIKNSGTASPLTVSLTGTGIYPVSLSPSGLSSGNVTLGNSSSAKTITLKNVQNVALTISSIAASANFKQTNNCPSTPNTLAAGGTCSINVVFTPPALGTTTGTVTVVHNAYGSPTAASLSGTGVKPVALSPTSLNFGFEKIGATSESRTVEVTNEQPVALTVTSIQTTGDFKQTNNCLVPSATLAAGASCSVTVTFAPTAAGIRTGQLSVSDSAVTSPQTVSLSGTGGAVLQSISVTPSTPSIAVGHTQQFTATGFYNDGSQKDVTASATWRSSPSKVATVSAGLATGVGAGKAIITATQSGISGSATLTVSSLTLMSIAVTPANSSIALGTQQQFHATGTYSNGSTLDITNSVTWASSSSAVATISAAGLVTSKAIGQSTISATNSTVSGSTVLTVTAAKLVAISVTPLSASVPLGTTQQFTATGTFTDGTMQNLTASATWTSSQSAIATVSAGLAIPVTTGATTITATVGSISGSTSLTVSAVALVSIAVTPPTPSVALGNSQPFTAIGTFTDGSTQNLTSQVSWGVANTTVASINSLGLALTAATGTTQITATSGSVTGSATLTVTAATLVTVTVTPAVPMVPLGENQQFTATGTFTDKSIQDITQTVSWSSSVPSVASISMTTGTIGLATALLQGTTTITATQSGVTGSTTLTVNPAALLSINLSPSSLTLPNGTSQQLVATGKYSDGTTQTLSAGVTWSSSNAGIATVSTSGLVTAVAATGSATISAQDGNVTGSLVAQVSSAVLVSIAVAPPTPSIPLGTTQQFTATGTYSDSSTQNLTSAVQWTSSTPGVATISVSSGTAGLAQSLATGSTTITAASGSVSATATLTVTPAALVSISIAPSAPSIDLGRSQQFTATGTYTDGTSSDLTTTATWSASPATVAIISNQAGSQGLATSAGVGSATITATLGTVSYSTTLTVGPATIVSIAVTPANSMISVGSTQQFTATATYTDGTTNDVTSTVTWSSAAATTAAMTNNVATGVAPGSVTVTAASGSVHGTASLTVFALPLISTFVPAATTITSGSAVALTANFANGTGVINPGAIAVSSGVPINLTPAATTTYTLTVTNAAGTFVTAQTTVTIVPAPVIASFTAGATTITAGTSTSLTSVFSYGNGVINPGAISVTSGAPVSLTPATTTTYTLTVTNAAGTSVTSATLVTVVPAPTISSFIAAATSITAGTSTTLTAVFANGTGSVDNGVGAVTNGTGASVSPAATTTYTLTVTNAAGTSVTKQATVNVYPAPTITSFVAAAASITAGTSTTLTAVFANGTGSVDNSVGPVTSSLPVTVSPTTTTTYTLTVTNAANASTTQTVTVTVIAAAALVSIAVTPSNSSIAMGGTQSFTATGTYSDSTTQPLTGTTVAWSSSTPGVATIDSTGLATGVALGRTSVTATSGGITGTTNLAVTGTGSFVPGGTMNSPRDPFTATLLNDGTVLIAGGYGPSGVLNSAELSDPLGQTFTLLNNTMNNYRAYHTATLLKNGLVLIVGGLDNNGVPTYTAELYNPATQTFTSTGGLNYERYLHTATLLSDGRVLVLGGIDSTNTTISYSEVYDPATGQFSRTGYLNTGRYAHTATLLNDGTVLVTGGGTNTIAPPWPTSQTNPTNSAELYTPSTGFFTLLNSTMSSTRAFHTATLLNNGTVLFAGGVSGTLQWPNTTSAAEIYSPSAGSFSNIGGMSYSRAYHTATLLNDGMVLIAGGATNNAGYFPPYPIGDPTGSAELYDPTAGFTPAFSMATARSQHTATLLNNGEVLIAGGATDSGGSNTNGTTTNLTELYQPATLTPAGVTTISVNPGNLTTVPIGTSQSFTATDNNGNQLASVVWSSSAPSIAIISNDAGFGLADFVAMGPVTITACAGSICGSTNFSVGPPALVSIAITPQNPFLAPSASPVALTATGTFTDGTTQNITTDPATTWTSSMTAVATIVLNTGVASPVAQGQTTITATSGSVSGSTTLTVSTVVLTGSLTSDRYGHTATLLNNGLVLLAGGVSNSLGWLTSADLYNPATGIVTPTGPMNFARQQPTSTLLNDGTVLITGGYYYPPAGGNALSIATAEIYNPATGTFTYTNGPMGYARALHTATLLRCACANDGKVLITGGQSINGTIFNTAELYDPSTQTFAPTGSMAVAREEQTATPLNDGTVLITGGISSTGTPNTVELYDPTQGTFTTISATLGNGLVQFSATLLNGGKVLLAGGSDSSGSWPNSRVYDPTSQTFSVGGGLNLTYRDFFTSTLLNNGTVLITGGISASGNVPTVASTEIYDPAIGTFAFGSTMNAARSNHTATLLSDGSGKVLIAGGVNVASAELYPPATLTPPNLVSITVTSAPANQTIVVSGGVVAAQRFVAMGTFSSGPAQQLASVTWNSSNTNVAQISNDVTNPGALLGLSAGTTTITACAGTICGSTPATITLASLNSITVTPAAPTTFVGARQFTATGNFVGGIATDVTLLVSWSSSNIGVATIGTAPSGRPGLAAPLAQGSTTITATFGAIAGTATLTVTPPSTITVTPANLLIGFNATVPFTATGNNADGSTNDLTAYVTWASSNTAIATMTGSTATGLARGATTITATLSANSASGTAVLNVGGFGASNGTLSQVREGHTATKLPNGKVLITGGQINPYIQSTNSAELYDPVTDTTTPTGSMTANREYHTATLLPNGKVLITGGLDDYNSFSGPIQASAEIYDPQSGTFTATGSMGDARYGHTAALLNNGLVLVTGSGTGGLNFPYNNSAELYDPAAGTFSYTGSMTVARGGHTATLLNNGQVLVVGGENCGVYACNSYNIAEIYDPVAGTFAVTGATNATYGGPTSTLLDNGKVLITGGTLSNKLPCYSGAESELYDPVAGTFTLTGTLTFASPGTATLLNDGQVLVTGDGESQTNTSTCTAALAQAELYDPVSGLWSLAGNMAQPRELGYTATLLDNGQVFIAAGFAPYTQGGFLSSTELFLPDSQTPPRLTSITVVPATSSSSIIAGVTTARFIAKDQNGQQLASDGVHWTVNPPGVGMMAVGIMTNDATDSGILIGLSAGAATVTACAGTICSSTTQNVLAFTSISVTPASPSVAAGLTDQFSATGTLSDGTHQDVTSVATWNSSDTTLATIAAGLATGVMQGTPTITASYVGVTSSPVTLTVTPPVLVSIAVTAASPAVVAGFTDQFAAAGTYSDNSVKEVTSSVVWSSTGAASINATSGLATGLAGGGVATITATSGSVNNSAALTVYSLPVSIAITPAVASVGVSDMLQFTATGTNSDSTTDNLTSLVTWTSNSAAATITSGASGGLASGISKGSATISAALGALSSNGVTLSVIGFGPATGSLNIARDTDAAVLLSDGRVLIIGGFNGSLPSQYLTSSELYDPSAGTFALTGALTTGRADFTTTLLPNGKVLVAGGSNQGNALASAELYDPATGTFTSTGSLATPRYSHTATLLPNGNVLVAGGFNLTGNTLNFLASAELYDPATGLFTSAGTMTAPRYVHTATLLFNGKVLIAGGYNATGALASAELYDSTNGTFSAIAGSMTTARSGATANLLNNGKVLLIGGTTAASAELYDPAASTFSSTGSPLTARNGNSATLLNNGQVLVAGGVDATGTILSSVELYESASGTFVSAGGMITGRYNFTATRLTKGNVLVAGGDGPGVLASAELYVPDSLTPPLLTSISVTPANPSISAGQLQTFVAIDQTTGQPLASVIWSSSNTAAAIVGNDGSDSGVAYSVAAGASTIQVCAGTVCGQTTLTVTGGGATCLCTKTGNYVSPVTAVSATTDPMKSPRSTYTVTPTFGASQTELVVTLTSNGRTVWDTGLLPNPISWGFSPDEGRFFYVSIANNGTPSQLASGYVYDLTATPVRPIVQVSTSSQVFQPQFSPSGRYFLFTELLGTAQTQMQIYKVQRVTAQTLVYQDQYAFQTPPGTSEDSYGGVIWGFSPDSPETSLVYGYVTGQGTTNWNVFNFTTSHHLSQALTMAAGFWQYDPCGGIIALVTQASLATQQVQISLYNTSTGLALAGSGAAIPSLSITLETTASGQEVVYSGTTQLLSSTTCQ